MLCDFNNPERTCSRCGFSARVEKLQMHCDLSAEVKEAIHAAAMRHGKGYVPKITVQSELVSVPLRTRGPGTELKKLLAGWPFRIVATPNCSCNAKAAAMDANEAGDPGWCERNIDTIVGWLREEATKRGLPFVDIAGRLLVKRAIHNARKSAS